MIKLSRPNFLDWIRNLRIFLKGERLAYVLDVPLQESLATDAFEEIQRAYLKQMDDREMVGCIMLTSMSPEL